MNRKIAVQCNTIIAGFFGASAVVLAALADHTLHLAKSSPFMTGVHYQLWHGILPLVIALLMQQRQHWTLRVASITASVGVVCFSGGIYLWSLYHVLRAIIPVGGTLLIITWLLLMLYGFLSNSAK